MQLIYKKLKCDTYAAHMTKSEFQWVRTVRVNMGEVTLQTGSLGKFVNAF